MLLSFLIYLFIWGLNALSLSISSSQAYLYHEMRRLFRLIFTPIFHVLIQIKAIVEEIILNKCLHDHRNLEVFDVNIKLKELIRESKAEKSILSRLLQCPDSLDIEFSKYEIWNICNGAL